MSCETECRSAEEHRKDSKISYTRGDLLSLAESIASKELPTGIDRSILSELDDACKSAPEHQKLPNLETPGDYSQELSERWVSCKLSSKDTKPTDSWKSYSNLSQRSWQKPGDTGILRSVQNPERNGILGSWSDLKLPSVGSEVSTCKLEGTDSCLLSRCNEPYRPPCFYKAMHHIGTKNHDTPAKQTSECAEFPSKERAVDHLWTEDACLVLEDHPTAPALTIKKDPLPVSPVVSGLVTHPCSAAQASEKCLTKESSASHPLAQVPVVQEVPSKMQLIKMDYGEVIDAEKSQGQILEGGQFSALIKLEEAEDIDAYFLYEKHGKIVDGRGNCRSNSRFIHQFPDYDNKDGRKVLGASHGMSAQENLFGQGKLKGRASTNGQRDPISKKTKPGVSKFPGPHCVVRKTFYPDGISHRSRKGREHESDKIARNQVFHRASGEVSGFQIVDQSDSNLEFNLPDEDNLISIDDTYIFDQDEPKPSPEVSFMGQRSSAPYPGSNKLLASESLHQKSNLPDPWFHECHVNSRNILVNPSNSLSHVYAPPTFHETWKNHHNHYYPFAAAPPPPVRMPLKPQNYEPSVENSLSHRILQADDYCPALDKILSAEPSIYHQLLQIPCCNKDPRVLKCLPPNVQTNVKASTDVGKRDLLSEKRNTINQYLQMQRKLAQMSLEAAEERGYNKTVGNFFR